LLNWPSPLLLALSHLVVGRAWGLKENTAFLGGVFIIAKAPKALRLYS